MQFILALNSNTRKTDSANFCPSRSWAKFDEEIRNKSILEHLFVPVVVHRAIVVLCGRKADQQLAGGSFWFQVRSAPRLLAA